MFAWGAGRGGGRALFAAHFVIATPRGSSHTLKYAPVRRRRDFALSIKNRRGREDIPEIYQTAGSTAVGIPWLEPPGHLLLFTFDWT